MQVGMDEFTGFVALVTLPAGVVSARVFTKQVLRQCHSEGQFPAALGAEKQQGVRQPAAGSHLLQPPFR